MSAPLKVDRAEFVTLAMSGATTAHLVARFGCSRATVARLRKAHGIPTPTPRKLQPTDLARIETALDDGWSFKEIHATHGYHPETIRNHFPGRAWTQHRRDDHARAIRHASPTGWNNTRRTL